MVLNEFWATASASYKAVVFGAMGLIAAGIVLNFIGQMTENDTVTFSSLLVIGGGLVVHAAGVVMRGHGVLKLIRKHSTKG